MMFQKHILLLALKLVTTSSANHAQKRKRRLRRSLCAQSANRNKIFPRQNGTKLRLQVSSPLSEGTIHQTIALRSFSRRRLILYRRKQSNRRRLADWPDSHQDEIDKNAMEIENQENAIEAFYESVFDESVLADFADFAEGGPETYSEYILHKIDEGDDALIAKLIGGIESDIPEGHTAGEYLKELTEANTDRINANADAIAQNTIAMEANTTAITQNTADLDILEKYLYEEGSDALNDKLENETVVAYLVRKADEFEKDIFGKDFDFGTKAPGAYLKDLIDGNTNEITALEVRVNVTIAKNTADLAELENYLYDKTSDAMKDKKESETIVEYLVRRAEEVETDIFGEDFDSNGKKPGVYLKELIQDNINDITAIEGEIADLEDAQNDLESAVADLEAKDDELADGLGDLEGAVTAKDKELAEDIQDLQDLLAKQLEDLKAELEYEKLADELADANSKLSDGGLSSNHEGINIDIDNIWGGKDHDSSALTDVFSSLELDWWHYLLIGLGATVIVTGMLLYAACRPQSSPLTPLDILPH